MKKTITVIALITLSAFYCFSQNSFQELSEQDISQTELRTAISMAEKILLGQKSGNIYLLSEDEAIPQVVEGLTKEVQISNYETLYSMFGDYKSMEFEEAWKLNSDIGNFIVYRFKGIFSNTNDKPEIRLVYNEESKLSGFWIRPWEDDLQGNP